MSKRKEEVADENAVDQSFENRAKDVREDILDDIKVPEVVTNTELEAPALVYEKARELLEKHV